MIQIITKRKKDNAKSRRCRQRGEHYAAYKAECDESRAMASRIEAAFTKLSEGCTSRVYKATMPIQVRSTEQPSADNICLPEVAKFAAGFRNVREDCYHVIKG
ncbi:hypothetical protein [Yersinia frederiksenii]|uniref:Uncharacterized protein n=1 Tax=Yersinia frederiksenii TaxID=29484 RepID=A0AAI8ZPP2_YERFR|nr:hypothetical protein [Yersinia frederiksenii]CFQ95820.1 Uncharacterised protein [Yersinia frederiksenii]